MCLWRMCCFRKFCESDDWYKCERTEINFRISPRAGIIERWEGTSGGVSSNSLLRVVLIPKLDQILFWASPEHLQGWRFPGPSGHLCQCCISLGEGNCQDFSVASCATASCTEESLDQKIFTKILLQVVDDIG